MSSGSSSEGLLSYCYYEKEKLKKEAELALLLEDVRGEMLFIQNLSLNTLKDGRFDMADLASQFDECAAKTLI